MFHRLLSRSFLTLAVLLFGFSTPAPGQQSDASSKVQEKKPQLRLICVTSLAEDQEVVLASKDDKGNWQERGAAELRSSFITDWLPASVGKLHLALRVGSELRSICQFTYPSSARRVLVVLIGDPQKQVYRANVIDPGTLNFVKGSTLLINFSRLPGAVVLGSFKTTVKPGESKVVKPVPEANGMYRMLAAYSGKDKEFVPCYDRYIPVNQDARDILFLLPDPTLGLKVFSLSEFGPFE